jgi:hypothetical protein
MARPAKAFLPPARSLDATIIPWGKGQQLHRIHDARYAGNSFNSHHKGNARFSPIFDPGGKIIPTLYAGTTLDCALMETIFHDVPFAPGFKPLSRSRLAGKVHTTFSLIRDLKLIDLSAVALRKLGVDRSHLIDTTKAHYRETRQWAERLSAQFEIAQGLRWTSRQDDRAQSVVFFGTRVEPSDLEVAGPPAPILVDDLAVAPVLDLAIRLGVVLVD